MQFELQVNTHMGNDNSAQQTKRQEKTHARSWQFGLLEKFVENLALGQCFQTYTWHYINVGCISLIAGCLVISDESNIQMMKVHSFKDVIMGASKTWVGV